MACCRYSEIVFDAGQRAFVCPVCTNTCNCSVCSRRRGEVYYGERTGGLAAAKRAPQQTASAPPPRKRARVADFSALAAADGAGTTYWGTVYGLSGEKVGTAFVGDDGNDRVVVARPTRTRRKALPALRRRVFVGALQAHWGVPPGGAVVDAEPARRGKGKGTGKAGACAPAAGRAYVGRRALLYARCAAREPLCEAPSLLTWESSSPVRGEEGGEDGAESYMADPSMADPNMPAALGDADVTRAILAALATIEPV